MIYVSNNVREVGLYCEFSSLITPTAAVLDYEVTAEYEHVRQSPELVLSSLLTIHVS